MDLNGRNSSTGKPEIESSRLRLEDPQAFKEKALHWASQFDTFTYLDSNCWNQIVGEKVEILVKFLR
jgi:hypothetical protein